MVGHNLSLARQAEQSQSAMWFYATNPWVGPIRAGSTVLGCATVVAVAWWIGSPGRAKLLGPVMLVLCSLGTATAWSESLLAAKFVDPARYSLVGLPVLPLANYGLLGSQAFLTYILASVVRRGGARPTLGLVFLWAVGLALAQWFAWDAVLHNRAG